MSTFGVGTWGEGTWGGGDNGPETAFVPDGVGVSPEAPDPHPLSSLIDVRHKYHYLISMSRNSGTTINYGRIDGAFGQELQHESAANATPFREDDYLESITLNDISSLPNSGNVINLTPPTEKNQHYTHYSIYRTKNIVADDADFATVENTYLFADEVPLIKLGYAILIEPEENNYSGVLTFTSRTMGIEDVGSRIEDSTGTEYLLVDFIEKVGNTVKFRIAAVGGGELPLIATNTWYRIGATTLFDGLRSTAPNGTPLYTRSFGTREFNSSDIGRQLFWADGNVSFIIAVNSIDEVALEEPVGPPNDFLGYGAFPCCTDPKARSYNDTITDTVLSGYQRSGENFFFLQTRFFAPLPNGGFGAIKGGAYFVSSIRNSEYYYSQLRDLYRTGCYHPSLQLNTKPVGVISRLKDYPDVLSIFGKNFTYYLDTTIEVNGGEELFGEFILVYSDPKQITKKVGCATEGCAAGIDGGGEIILTNEPAVRYFDGFKYGENIATNLVQDSEISQFKIGVVMEWDKRRGLNIWGLDG